MIDFTELPEDGLRFEQLVRELLIREEYGVRWTGVGPDGGRDLILTERSDGPLAPFERTWLVSCKHKAHSGASVGLNDLDKSIVDSCRAIGAKGFILACSTQPSSSFQTRLREIEQQNAIICKVWDSVELERRLMRPNTFSLQQIFFPQSAAATQWTVFNAGSPTFWCGSFKGHFFYMSSRVPAGVPRLQDMEAIVCRLEGVRLGESLDFGQRERLRLRAVHFDNKNENYTVFADYLVPISHADDGNRVLQQTYRASDILKKLCDGHGLYSETDDKGVAEWYSTFWDVVRVKTSQLSDGFDQDNRRYYEPSMEDFKFGQTRDEGASSFCSSFSSWND